MRYFENVSTSLQPIARPPPRHLRSPTHTAFIVRGVSANLNTHNNVFTTFSLGWEERLLKYFCSLFFYLAV